MNENSKSFYSKNMFEFIYYPKYTTETTYENLLKDNVLVVDSTSLQRKISRLEALRSIHTIPWLCNHFISNTMQYRMFPTPTSSKGSTTTIVWWLWPCIFISMNLYISLQYLGNRKPNLLLSNSTPSSILRAPTIYILRPPLQIFGPASIAISLIQKIEHN